MVIVVVRFLHLAGFDAEYPIPHRLRPEMPGRFFRKNGLFELAIRTCGKNEAQDRQPPPDQAFSHVMPGPRRAYLRKKLSHVQINFIAKSAVVVGGLIVRVARADEARNPKRRQRSSDVTVGRIGTTGEKIRGQEIAFGVLYFVEGLAAEQRSGGHAGWFKALRKREQHTLLPDANVFN